MIKRIAYGIWCNNRCNEIGLPFEIMKTPLDTRSHVALMYMPCYAHAFTCHVNY